jgi:uncharacterized protein (DUF4415 family)
MKGNGMKRSSLSKKERKELGRLEALSDVEIDTDDIPEAPAENWRFARRGDLYRPVKKPVTIRLDADVLAWFREHSEGKGYQTEINRVLRRHIAKRGIAGRE